MRLPLRSLVAFACLPLGWLSGCAAATDETAAFFQVETSRPSEAFTIMVTDPAKIAEAKAIVSGSERQRVHVMGIVVKQPQLYNAPWRFHLDPVSITFFETAIEVCDAATSYVDQNLAEVGGAVLPNSRWCPWTSKVAREVEAPVDGATVGPRLD
jgi:hypothetical protein